MSEVKVNKISPRSGTDVTLGDSGDTFTIPSGATLTNNGTASGFGDNLEWQSSIVTAATITVSANKGYWLDTSSNAITVTLPGTAAVGDRLIFTDYARNWATNAVTIDQNSLKFQGNTSPNPVYNTNGQSVDIVYSGATKGWIPNSDDDVTFETPQTYTADFLVIAGGGGGGKLAGGGGGAGGYRNSFSSESSGGGGSSETALALNPGTVYTVTVGAGGSAGSPTTGGNGVASSISGSDITDISSTAGGGGGSSNASSGAGNAGGSGGGGGGEHNSTAGSGTANQGFAGGAGSNAGPNPGGGGGGASATGNAGDSGGAGDGGAGLSSSINGSATTRGGGGGGSGKTGGSGVGGSGGGGEGASNSDNSTAGTANKGGGAGGAHDGNAAAGGSGVVILSMADADYSGTTTGSPTVATGVSGKTVLTFNASGSYTG